MMMNGCSIRYGAEYKELAEVYMQLLILDFDETSGSERKFCV